MLDFTIWDALLRQYVDLQGRVDYKAWKREQPQAISEWLSSLEKIDKKAYANSNEQLALWINLYNAFTISTILERYPIDSIRTQILGIPNWLAFLWFFQRRAYTFDGHRYSLAQIENKILRDRLQEPRIHFAIVCASVGCPLLRNSAYEPALVQPQLDEDARRFINNPDKVRYDSQTGTLYCSRIFKWYRQDFLQIALSVPEYIGSYLETDLPLTSKTPITYLYYNWSLNQRMSS
ncbi:MAG: DUF547 domain-containing protein [Chamaesiphon sp.]